MPPTAWLFLLARQDVGDLDVAESHCLRLLDAGGPAKERAKALLREARPPAPAVTLP